MNLVRSKQRVADHGEVFTPPWMSNAMIAMVKDEADRVESRFLEPSCGEGAFLTQILNRKLIAVKKKFKKKSSEMSYYAIIALMSIYGIEILPDNVVTCRENMLDVFSRSLDIEQTDNLYTIASYVVSQNIVHGDALSMRTNKGQPIIFAEWKYLGKEKFQRRDYRLDALSNSIGLARPGSVPSQSSTGRTSIPYKTYPPISLNEMALVCMVKTVREAG